MDIDNVKFQSGLTYSEAQTLTEAYIERISGEKPTTEFYKQIATRYLAELVRDQNVWRRIVSEV